MTRAYCIFTGSNLRQLGRSNPVFAWAGVKSVDQMNKRLLKCVYLSVNTGPILGHVGDGNFHVTFFVDKEDQEGIQKVQRIANQIAEYVSSHLNLSMLTFQLV